VGQKSKTQIFVHNFAK